MSAWAGKYVIGLTGNIATGKSVVRRMLEHLGAYSIDADTLAHRTFLRGADGFQPVLDSFGEGLLGPDGEISRSALGKRVFTDPAALKKLEQIIHPLVRRLIHRLVANSAFQVIVIEAIKLLESGLADHCDTLWVTYASQAVQLRRLVALRSLPEDIALQRINVQPAQEIKLAVADTVIQNDGNLTWLWEQVANAWRIASLNHCPSVLEDLDLPGDGQFLVRVTPDDWQEIAGWFGTHNSDRPLVDQETILVDFSRRGFWFVKGDLGLSGLLGWRADNLVARLEKIYLAREGNLADLLPAMEKLARGYQCELSLVLPPNRRQEWHNELHQHGYQAIEPTALRYQPWIEAAQELFTQDNPVWAKPLTYP